MTKQVLLQEWNLKKQDFTDQEIGSGTQSFVRKVIESSEVFGLGEGSLKQENYIKKYLNNAKKLTICHRGNTMSNIYMY